MRQTIATAPAMNPADTMLPANACVRSAGHQVLNGRIGSAANEGSGFQTNPSAARC